MSKSGYLLLPIAILRVRAAPKTTTKLSPFEMTCRRLFLTLDTLIDPEAQAHLKYIINLGQVQKAIQEYGSRVQPAPDDSPSYPVAKCGDWVLLATWKNEYPGNQLLPKCKGPYQVLLSTLIAVKLQSVTSWVHLCPGLNLSPVIGYRNLKNHIPATPVNPPLPLSLHRIQKTRTAWKFQGESLEDLKLLFKKKINTS